MALDIKLTQKLSQSLVMTPQLQQAIKLLQLGRQEYLEVLEKELLENPVLEDGREDEPERSSDEGNSELEWNTSNGADASPQKAEQSTQELTNGSTDGYDAPAGDNADWWSVGKGGSFNSSNDGVSLVEATVSNSEGLDDFLLSQVRTSELDSAQQDVAAYIIGNLDRDGYFKDSIDECASACNSNAQMVEEVLNAVQNLEPSGIAARDLRECLLIQLDQQGKRDTLVWRVVDKYLGALEMRQYDDIARAEGVDVEEIYEAVKEIRKLDPRPGRPYSEEAPIYITPDIYVRKVGNEFVISLNESNMPRLRVSNHYRELLEKGKLSDAPNKEYLQDRIKSAAWLIKSIHQRQQTIYKVTESIMKFQRDFLTEGIGALKPLVLRDVASDVDMHESTVSRVTTNKFVHTPQGVFELKFFFSSGIQSGEGSVSSEAVKNRIQALVSEEDSKKPLSDQAIVNMLKDEGISIARRTVAKYREMMGILSSSRRKKMF